MSVKDLFYDFVDDVVWHLRYIAIWRPKLPPSIDFWEREVRQGYMLQREIVKDQDKDDEPWFDDRPTPSEAYHSMKFQVSKLGTALRNYFDPSYRRITWGQAIDALQEAGLVGRLGGMGEQPIIIGGQDIVVREDGQQYYDNPFTIEQLEERWEVATGTRTLYARNLDEAVKATIRAYVREDVDSRTVQTDATAIAATRTSLENVGALSG